MYSLLVGIQAFMAFDGFCAYLGMTKGERRGHRRPLACSAIILIASSIDVVLDLWMVFDSIFLAGPDGRSYIVAFKKTSEGTSPTRRLIIVVSAMAGVTVTAGDVLLVRR
jgi:hypothetical protein